MSYEKSKTNHEQGTSVPCSSLISEDIEHEKPFFITWVTHNSRISQRMIDYKIKKGEPVFFNNEQEIEITRYIFSIVKEKEIKVITYNICRDHIHIIIVCKYSELDSIVRILKGKTTFLYKKNNNISEPIKIWAQKYNCSFIETEEKLYNSIRYIKNNRKKHNLTESYEIEQLVIDNCIGMYYM